MSPRDIVAVEDLIEKRARRGIIRRLPHGECAMEQEALVAVMEGSFRSGTERATRRLPPLLVFVVGFLLGGFVMVLLIRVH